MAIIIIIIMIIPITETATMIPIIIIAIVLSSPLSSDSTSVVLSIKNNCSLVLSSFQTL